MPKHNNKQCRGPDKLPTFVQKPTSVLGCYTCLIPIVYQDSKLLQYIHQIAPHSHKLRLVLVQSPAKAKAKHGFQGQGLVSAWDLDFHLCARYLSTLSLSHIFRLDRVMYARLSVSWWMVKMLSTC